MSQKRKDLTLSEQVSVINDLSNKILQSEIAKKYGISQSQVSRIKTNQEKIMDKFKGNANPNKKRQRESTRKDVDKALYRWYTQASLSNVTINGRVLLEKAEALAKQLDLQGTVSRQWIHRWCQRRMVKLQKLPVKKKNIKKEAANDWLRNVWPGIYMHYSAEDIYNCDETAVYYRALPGSFVFQNEKSSGGSFKVNKERMTVLLACNWSGTDKKKLLIVGKSSDSVLRGLKSIPVQNVVERNAWMTSSIFERWLMEFDNEMVNQNRKVCLLLDSCTSHRGEFVTKAVHVVLIPSNISSPVQPMENGISKNFKSHYRGTMIKNMICQIDGGKFNSNKYKLAKSITLLDAIHLLSNAWIQVRAELIQYCFTSTFAANVPQVCEGFLKDYVPENISVEAYKRYVEVDDDLPTEGELSLEELCAGLGNNNNEYKSEEVEEDISDPTNCAVMEALGILKNRIYTRGLLHLGFYLFALEDGIRNEICKSTQQNDIS